MVCFAATLRWHIRPMAKIELSRVPLVGWLLGKAGVIYVDRGHADVKGGEGGPHLPEGRRQDAGIPRGHPGPRRGGRVRQGGSRPVRHPDGVPIVPVYVSRKKYWFRRSPVIIGKPITPKIAGRKATSEELEKIMNDVMEQIYQLGETA